MNRPQHGMVIAIQSKTKMVKNDLLKDRELKRVEQLKTNAEIRRRALEADQSQANRQNNG